mmetsp:Transcript_17715/g.50114  ORF Transcript_17715/g.50114 Transcript_17715/m.50114 type:complete len:201 (+) Transcript_17715:544-1146(+)
MLPDHPGGLDGARARTGPACRSWDPVPLPVGPHMQEAGAGDDRSGLLGGRPAGEGVGMASLWPGRLCPPAAVDQPAAAHACGVRRCLDGPRQGARDGGPHDHDQGPKPGHVQPLLRQTSHRGEPLGYGAAHGPEAGHQPPAAGHSGNVRHQRPGVGRAKHRRVGTSVRWIRTEGLRRERRVHFDGTQHRRTTAKAASVSG